MASSSPPGSMASRSTRSNSDNMPLNGSAEDLSRLSLRKWPRTARAALLSSPEVTIILPSGTPLRPPTLIGAPRAALVAFSTVAAAQLANPATVAVHLPPGAAAPPALNFVISWMRLACAAEFWTNIIKKPDFRQNVFVYHAAVSLGVTEAVKTLMNWFTWMIGQWSKGVVNGGDEVPKMDMEHVTPLFEHIPKEDVVVKALVKVLVKFSREGEDLLDDGFKMAFEAYLIKNPGLRELLETADEAYRQDRAKTLIYGGNVRNDLVAGPATHNWRARANYNAKPWKGKAKAADEKKKIPGSEYILDEDEVNKIMGRRG
ncbi:hypothetical protein K490DRAFT_62349 [Saccharata proteae CBS 121410]|uniref:Uncharacterized protein n=1 Tax=Saccharata proteae CBS 121410 TaxID=1314787 RepID=A0A9P4LXX1_9PEZI|nr:hypothetical protein K490DRAFT_62349 [Saccharata proteae CBS 121410]